MSEFSKDFYVLPFYQKIIVVADCFLILSLLIIILGLCLVSIPLLTFAGLVYYLGWFFALLALLVSYVRG